ncbi:hypothetical protein P175DRAFT_0523291 [Aspergillus ochraceoroseus IBT 24754]|uniref:Transcription factor domain-containing protein n=1 Tax=Aspergillus ochraceoroseus IBT 24754 TaxID=1392256 RepID=A0A2T5M0S9_9EURO|nr:uncharacterized protein P175DRAFT_0523291 [Aspergillus ochraceoroseus IBT 24754]PTU22136.1 hypothetical protein P175DRAFT_0523291 [Aspergillus ochraceoroseus IBT 24754]
MPANGGARERKRDAIHFVNARPASETERLTIRRMVRAHVGKWISTQTKDRAAGSTLVEPPPSIITTTTTTTENTPELPSSRPLDFDPDESFFPSPSTSSTISPPPSHSSCASPESCVSHASHGVPLPSQQQYPPPPPPLPSSAPSESQTDLSLALVPARTNLDNFHHRCDGPGCQCGTWSVGSDSPSPPPEGGFIEAIGAAYIDPFRTYPSQFEPELIQISETYCLSTLWPGLTPGPSPTNMSSWFPMSLSDPTLFTAFLYGSLSHRRVQSMKGWIPREGFRAKDQRLLELCEMETIKMVSREMNNPTRAVCDAMIFSVVCMAHNKSDDNIQWLQSTPFTAPMQRLQWLDIYGCLPPNMVHITGLVQMVNLRGGLEKIELPGLASIISFSDLVTSSTFLAPPIFPFVPLDASRKGKTMQDLLGYTNAGVDHYFGHIQQLGLPRDLAEIFCAINAYTEIVEQCVKWETKYDTSLLADQRNLLQYDLISLPSALGRPDNPAFSPVPHESSSIYEACRLACLVYGVGVVLPLPAQSTPLARLSELIQTVLQNSNYSTVWASTQAQIALLWVLTLGGISAHNRPNRSWYVNMLKHVVLHNDIQSWADLSGILGIIAWYPRACDKPGHDLWLEVENSRGVFN